MMDIEALAYNYSVLAAAAFYHFSSLEVVLKVTGESRSLPVSLFSLLFQSTNLYVQQA